MPIHTTWTCLCLLWFLVLPGIQKVHPQSSRRISSEQILANRMMQQGDLNGDEHLSTEEWKAVTDSWFARLDAGGAGSLSREEFLSRIPTLLAEPRSSSRRPRGMLPSRFLEFFVALDTDSNGLLLTEEYEGTTQRWFRDWCKDSVSDTLSEARLAEGFQKVFPKTNMSGASLVESQDPVPGLPDAPPSPVLTPMEALQTLHIVEGFEIKLAAADPLIQDPVALSFDQDGNVFVVEMRSFMLDMDRGRELDPVCRISYLKDADGDGSMDHARVFLDNLVVPRAVMATMGGILFVEDYQLHFAKDTDGDGRADMRKLMDPDYGRSNIEHAPNGLMRAMDNWIYNGRSPWRYRWLKGRFVRERTEARGQWGMTQDQHGRLFYNVNNSQLLGDFSPPNYMGRNSHYRSTAGLNLFVATDQRIFTSRMNTAVNRGYLPDVLDEKGHLHVFASSCSPVIYRGDQYGSEFNGNAFVCDPAANIIKRNFVFNEGMTLTAQQAYEGFEFLASTDERFRPVNLYNGPDGTLWILDMYRGIAQYGMFMTDYLRRETLKRDLHKGIHQGRLYRVVDPKRKQRSPLNISTLPKENLVSLLAHPDGWIRDSAQRLIVETSDYSVVPPLIKSVKTSDNDLEVLHALWTLEGLFMDLISDAGTRSAKGDIIQVYSLDDLRASSLPNEVWEACLAALNHSNLHVQSAALRVCESFSRGYPDRQAVLLTKLEKISDTHDMPVLFQCALTAGNLALPETLPVMVQLASEHADEWLIREALLSGLENWEITFLQMLLSHTKWKEQSPGRVLMLQSLAKAVAAEGKPSNLGLLLATADGQSGDLSWRGSSLLLGTLEHLQASFNALIYLPRKPPSWKTLLNHETTTIRELTERLGAYVVWPGHPDYKVRSHLLKETPVNAEESLALQQGAELYLQICAGCHGAQGEGLKAQAPPLHRSEWVLGSSDRLIRIVLQGMQGPVHVRGTRYSTPEILSEMPPLSVLEDFQLTAILNFIRNEWGHNADWVNTEDVNRVRQETASQEFPWKESELLKIQ